MMESGRSARASGGASFCIGRREAFIGLLMGGISPPDWESPGVLSSPGGLPHITKKGSGCFASTAFGKIPEWVAGKFGMFIF